MVAIRTEEGRTTRPRIKRIGWRRAVRALLAVGVVCSMAALAAVQRDRVSADEPMPATIPVTIETVNGPQTIQVEIACRLEERALGLMGRATLAPDSGMIFLLPTARPMRMWMKDTPLALDMIFFDLSHKIIRIESNAQPKGERVIESGGNVIGVLEIAGGRAEALKITHGNKVLYTYPQERCE